MELTASRPASGVAGAGLDELDEHAKKVPTNRTASDHRAARRQLNTKAKLTPRRTSGHPIFRGDAFSHGLYLDVQRWLRWLDL
jgi:hypothetical protein